MVTGRGVFFLTSLDATPSVSPSILSICLYSQRHTGIFESELLISGLLFVSKKVFFFKSFQNLGHAIPLQNETVISIRFPGGAF